MHGNVEEWCQDRFGNDPPGPVIDPQGPPSGGERVLRGGSWINHARNLRYAFRDHSDPGNRDGSTGFRLALGPEPGQDGPGGQAGSGAGLPAQGARGNEREGRAVRSRGGVR